MHHRLTETARRPTVRNDHERTNIVVEQAKEETSFLKYRQKRNGRFLLLVAAILFIVYKRFGRPHNTKKEGTSRAVEATDSKMTTNEFSASQVLAKPLNLSSSTVKVHKPASISTCSNTIVSAYFRVKSKFSADNYYDWMRNMLSLQDCVIVFTQSDMVEKVLSYRKQHAVNKTIVVEMDIDDLAIRSLHQNDANFWQHQLDMDREKKRHKSFQLFWIWLSKTWLVVQAMELNYFSSDFFMYSDIGCFRKPNYNDKLLIQHTELVPPGTVLWLAHHPPNAPPSPLWNDKFGQKQYYYHSGSQGAATASTWKAYHQAFAQTMDDFLAHNMFIGEDQCVLQATCQQHSDLCAYVDFTQVQDNHYFGLRYILHHGGKYTLWRPRLSGGKESAR